jgi:DNA (cytosine-5)-methyltransferase 1
MCRLQTFPDNISFQCGRSDMQKMLGNAVPSLLAEVLAREIRRQLLDKAHDPGPLQLIPPVRTPVSAPEPVTALPYKYRCLIADHADHPGEGRMKEKIDVKSRRAYTAPIIKAAE